ncbi:MAG TPA: sigma-70 family RNA polymerase sigma factor [Protaetiibacter sp.]|nr:sigma-70 family RNA polymerase sigma factor [Protaetiibacter sp.]
MPDARAEFADVYRRHLPAVSAYLARRVPREDVEDLASDVFAIAWRKRATVTPGEELPWLYRIASFQVANHRRRLAMRASLLGALAAPDSAPAADAFLDADPGLAAAWGRLSARHREVLGLVVVEGVSVAEAAIALGVSANAVSIRLHRAKRALAAELAATPEAPAAPAADAGERSGAPAT